MNFEKVLEGIRAEKVEPYLFEKEDGCLLEDEQFQEWSKSIGYLGDSLTKLAMVTSEDLSEYEIIRDHIDTAEMTLVYDNGEGTLHGYEHNGIKFIVGLGPVDCVIVAEAHLNVLKAV